MNYTYILKCRDGSLYTGWTNDLRKRIKAHNEGKGAKYTKSRAPVSLVYFEEYETKQEAQKREYAIKRCTKKQKLSLISKMDGEALRAALCAAADAEEIMTQHSKKPAQVCALTNSEKSVDC